VSFTDAAGDARDFFPSVVAVKDGAWKYGWDALGAAATDSGWTLLRSFKRLLSGADAGPATIVTLGDESLPLTELLAGFLGALRADAGAGVGGALGRRRGACECPWNAALPDARTRSGGPASRSSRSSTSRRPRGSSTRTATGRR